MHQNRALAVNERTKRIIEISKRLIISERNPVGRIKVGNGEVFGELRLFPEGTIVVDDDRLRRLCRLWTFSSGVTFVRRELLVRLEIGVVHIEKSSPEAEGAHSENRVVHQRQQTESRFPRREALYQLEVHAAEHFRDHMRTHILFPKVLEKIPAVHAGSNPVNIV